MHTKWRGPAAVVAFVLGAGPTVIRAYRFARS
jgi:hypothetical protein